ncbi:MAG: protein kinase, partial [Phycisphaerales bacterium JB039]
MSHQSAESIFYQARTMPPAERESFLKDACAGDVGLRAKVEALLQAEAAAGSFLKTVAPEGEGAKEEDPAGGANGVTIASPGAEQPGQMIGRYKLLQRIGEGGFGTVWMAEQREPVKRRVALKIIKLGMDTKQVIARFEAERQALAMMDHPNIA